MLVDVADMVPQHRLDAVHAVPGGVGGNLGLVDRDGREVERLRGEHPTPTEHERTGQVDDVGSEALEESADAGDASGGDADTTVLRQGDRGNSDDASSGDLLRSVPAGARGDDENLVAAVGQMVEDPQE
jgi:hypothetical protein